MRGWVAGLLGAIAISGGALAAWQAPRAGPPFSFAEPGIAPDGREIAFSSGGGIWIVPIGGGDARLVVSDGASDRRPLFSPDGRDLAYVSTRSGGGDIHVRSLATGDVRRVTADDGLEQLDAWSRDGRWVYFSTTGHDIGAMNDVYRVSIDGGTPMPVTDDPYVNEFQASPSPDGRSVAFVARGVASSDWWRRGGSHLDRSELWLLDLSVPRAATAYRELMPRDARQEWPMWTPDGRSLFYVSDRATSPSAAPPVLGAPVPSPVENIWRHDLAGGADRPLTAFRDGRVLWPSITVDGRTIAFERDFGVWTLDVASGRTQEVPIVRRDTTTPPAPAPLRITSGFSDLALAPDGSRIALVARGALFAASARDAGDAVRIAAAAGLVSQPAWSPDGRRLAFVSQRAAGQGIDVYDATSGVVSSLTSGAAIDLSPVFSPDGRRLAFLRSRRELHVLDLDTSPPGRDGADRTLATGIFADSLDSPRPVWSPDGKWIAVFAVGANAFTNVDLVSLAGGPPRPVSFLADAIAEAIAWSPDGSGLFFDTRQPTEPGRLARVDLQPRTPVIRHDALAELSEPVPGPAPTAADAEPSPASRSVTPVFGGIRDRLSLVPVGLDVRGLALSPDGRTACVLAAAAGQTNLYAYSLDDALPARPVARQLTTTASEKGDPVFSPDGAEVYYLDAGRVSIVSLDRREAHALAVTAEMTVDVARERQTLFDEVWTLVRDAFFDPAFHGVDWSRARGEYGARVAAAGTSDEMRRLLRLVLGDLGPTPIDVDAPGDAPLVTGRLGATFDRAAAESAGRLVLASIVPLGPLAVAGHVGPRDAIVAVNGEPIGPRVNLDERLAGTIGRLVVLSIAPAGGAPVHDVVVRPVDQATDKALLYRAWVETNRQYVLEHSGGRLGYVHLDAMTAASVDRLSIELDAQIHERDGVVIDVRNNDGGADSASVLDVFARQPYLRVSTRAVPDAPARSVFGPRALELPTVLVTNQHTRSGGEAFVEGYRTLKLGPIVGEPTAGRIVFARDVPLVDGTTLRLPSWRVRATDGSDVDGRSIAVDVAVTTPVGERLAGSDAQLDAAIRTLLARIGRAE